MGLFLLSTGASASVAEAAPALERLGHAVTVTAYSAVPEQTDENPFETASGAYSNPEIVAARSRDLADTLPFGTIIELDGSGVSSDGSCGFGVVEEHIGYRVIADTMHSRFTDRVDVLLDATPTYRRYDGKKVDAATVLGICNDVTFRVVGHVDINHMPKTQAELAAIVAKQSGRLALR